MSRFDFSKQSETDPLHSAVVRKLLPVERYRELAKTENAAEDYLHSGILFVDLHDMMVYLEKQKKKRNGLGSELSGQEKRNITRICNVLSDHNLINRVSEPNSKRITSYLGDDLVRLGEMLQKSDMLAEGLIPYLKTIGINLDKENATLLLEALKKVVRTRLNTET